MSRERYIIAISGASGFVGSRLQSELSAAGHEVRALTRMVLSSPQTLAKRLTGAHVVVNLAGAPIISRWTEDYKKTLYSSRIDTTRQIVDALATLDSRPELLISASAVGIYATGVHTEGNHTLSEGFLGRLAQDWEAEAMRAESIGLRTVVLRLGIVLSPEGGALKKMLGPFRLALGGRIGTGRQYVSWVHMDDLVRVVFRAIEDEGMRGAYNLTAPNPVTNAGFTRALAHVVGLPAIFRVPEFVLRLQFGQGASVLTEGQRVLPERLLKEGFEFRHSEIGQALEYALHGD